MPPTDESLSVLVLAGGPDREREVSLASGACVAQAASDAGHRVTLADVMPDQTESLRGFAQAGGDVVFPVLHGPWGEGGGLQRLLEAQGLPFVGSRSPAAERCIDKHATKLALREAGLPTADWRLLSRQAPDVAPLEPPLVIKPLREGSSIDLAVCRDAPAAARAADELLRKYDRLLAERFVAGLELTCGVVERDGSAEALPPLEIATGSGVYDFEAKYRRDDTVYRFEIDLPEAVLGRLAELAVAAHRRLGAAHLSRVDFIVEPAGAVWILEINTLPGFTDHSLLPKAADRAGLSMPRLVDMLLREALREPASRRSAGRRQSSSS